MLDADNPFIETILWLFKFLKLKIVEGVTIAEMYGIPKIRFEKN